LAYNVRTLTYLSVISTQRAFGDSGDEGADVSVALGEDGA